MLYFQNAISKQNFMQILAKECKKKKSKYTRQSNGTAIIKYI